jgi:hypothetical protein
MVISITHETMLRFIRGLIYGVAAGLTVAMILNYAGEGRGDTSRKPKQLGSGKKKTRDPIDDLSNGARQALLDELGAQL